MFDVAAALDWIDSRHGRMCELLTQWAQINSGSYNLPGLERMAEAILPEVEALGEVALHDLPPFARVEGSGEIVATPVGRAVTVRKIADGTSRKGVVPLRVLLCIHMDTVYPADGPFQEVEAPLGTPNRLRGPGVTDAKGGLLVMITALQAVARSRFADALSWEVVINADEEIGSQGSIHLLADAARRNDLGLLFEPTLDEAGTLASSRAGSGNFTLVVRGQSAHAGRAIEKGRNAVVAAAELGTRLHAFNGQQPGLTCNVARIEGGGPMNVVPDLALVRFNVRVDGPTQTSWFKAQIDTLLDTFNQRDGIRVELHGGFHSPPKPKDAAVERLMCYVAACGSELGIDVKWGATRGVCDGNKLAAAGLPNIDTLGVRGGAIHSPDEYVILDSLTERAKLTAMILMRLASGELPWDRVATDDRSRT